MEYLKAKDFRQFTEFTVKTIYPAYRSGGVKTADGRFIGKTFVEKDGKFMEKHFEKKGDKWDISLIEPTVIIDRDFFKTYKKVYDVVITTGEGNEFTIQGLGVYKIQLMLKADMDFDVPMNGDKEQFDWEDSVYKNIEGRTYKMKVTGAGLDTEYRISLVDVQSQKEVFDSPDQKIADVVASIPEVKYESDVKPSDLPFNSSRI